MAAAYAAHLATLPPGCAFCDRTNTAQSLIERRGSMLVIRNKFPYLTYDTLPVIEHLMVVPERHLLRLAQFEAAEVADYFEVCAAYEDAGYSLYTRAHSNTARSVAHLHTHLIRMGDRT